MGGFGFNLPEEEQEKRRFDVGAQSRVAPPNPPPSSIPPVNLPGLGPPAPSTQSSAPVPIARPIGNPADERTAHDQAELSRLERTGTGVSQLAKRHPIGGGILNALDKIGTVAGNIYAPLRGITSVIPGTTAHHNALIGEQRGRIAEDLGEQQAQGGMGEVAARALKEKEEALKAHTEAGQIGQPHPKEEKWDAFTGYTDTDGTPLMREENSGQVVRASDKKPPTGFQVAKSDKPFQTREITRVVNGVPHTVMVDAQTGADVKDEGQTKIPGESPENKRNALESSQVERESRQAIRKAEGQYRATEQSVNQLTASIDAAKDGNGLLTSFVPTMEVLGINTSNGVHRISPAEAQAAGMPGGWAERFNAWFDKASSGQLSPQLQAEGKALAGILKDSAYQRYKSTYEDESGIVSGYGGTDFGKRVPLIPGGGQNGPQQAGPPHGATMKVPGSDGKMHWSDGKQDLGVAE